MKYHFLTIIAGCLLICFSCKGNDWQSEEPCLREELYSLIHTVPGTVGIAYVSDTDTVAVNNGVHFPMMSVFKLHEALAVADAVEKKGNTLDSLLNVNREELDLDTWSPMLKKYPDGDFRISIGELTGYAITQSDNNASNLLFKHIVSPSGTNDFIKSIAKDTTFRICLAESEMKANPALSYLNHTSPLSAALLIRQVFEEPLVEPAMQDSIKHYLSIVTTGQDRLGTVVEGSDIQLFAHKTGSGYRNEAGELMAHNDVGYFRFADGRNYSLAVFIRDFSGSEEEASRVMADISRCVYRHFKKNSVKQIEADR